MVDILCFGLSHHLLEKRFLFVHKQINKMAIALELMGTDPG